MEQSPRPQYEKPTKSAFNLFANLPLQIHISFMINRFIYGFQSRVARSLSCACELQNSLPCQSHRGDLGLNLSLSLLSLNIGKLVSHSHRGDLDH